MEGGMKILVACEFSGIVRDAFTTKGHDAWSSDFLESELAGKHLKGDVLKWLKGKPPIVSTLKPEPWHLLIAHPPCTYLCNSGVRWLVKAGVINKERHLKMMEAADFFAALYWADIPHVAIENPVMHNYARDYLKSAWKIPTYTQSIQPFQFGHGETKRTCLWLRNLPELKPSEIVQGRIPRVHHASPGPDRWKERSRTLPGIGKAMATQWGDL